MRVAIDAVIGVGWLVFWIYWLIMATTAKPGNSRLGQFAGFRVAVVVLLLFLVRSRVIHIRGGVIDNPVLMGVGLAVWVLGLALAIWARVYLGRNWGVPMSQRAEPELVTTGPYHKVRHPIYTGIIVAFLGSALALGWYWFIAAAIIGAYFVYSAVVEERNMAKLFPDTYPAYKHATKMLIPYIL
jgi:protein-S-isoprenylcysteine O-methyltransferase Ste14